MSPAELPESTTRLWWYVHDDGTESGPFTLEDARQVHDTFAGRRFATWRPVPQVAS